MSQGGEAADQMVNMAANVTAKFLEVGADITIRGSTALGTFLILALKDQKRTKGRVRLASFQGKPTKVFVIQRDQLKDFALECKKYGVMYAAILDKRNPDGLVDIIVNDADAAKVNRIAERFGMSAVEVEHLREEILRSRDAAHGPQAEHERTDPAVEHSINEAMLDGLLQEKPAPMREPQQPFIQDENPTMARTEKEFNPFAPLSTRSENSETVFNEKQRPSVRQEIRALKAGRAEKERQRGLPEPEKHLGLPSSKDQPQPPAAQLPQMPPLSKDRNRGR